MGKGMKASRKPKKAPTGGMRQQVAQVQAMQKMMEDKQAEINEMETTASAGGGAVTVTVTGAKEIKEIILKPEIVDPDDVEMLQDLILAATNEALRKMDEISNKEMEELTGGLGLPPGLF